MIRTFLILTTLSLSAAACGSALPKLRGKPASSVPAKPASVRNEVEGAANRDIAHKRQVGDFFVHRYSGSYTETPLTLSEEVVAVEDGQYVIDYEFVQGSSMERLRVRIDAETEKLVRVSKLEGEQEIDVAPAVYQALMDKTVFAADLNEGLIDSEPMTCTVGPSELDCEMKNYRVLVGDAPANLSVTQSEQLGGRDVAGEITGEDGTVIYRSELLEMHRGEKGSVAATD